MRNKIFLFGVLVVSSVVMFGSEKEGSIPDKGTAKQLMTMNFRLGLKRNSSVFKLTDVYLTKYEKSTPKKFHESLQAEDPSIELKTHYVKSFSVDRTHSSKRLQLKIYSHMSNLFLNQQFITEQTFKKICAEQYGLNENNFDSVADQYNFAIVGSEDKIVYLFDVDPCALKALITGSDKKSVAPVLSEKTKESSTNGMPADGGNRRIKSNAPQLRMPKFFINHPWIMTGGLFIALASLVYYFDGLSKIKHAVGS